MVTVSHMIRLLIIDDNVTFLNVARELLLKHRRLFVVDTASDAEKGLLEIHRHHYDVVVSDIRLPGVQGLELLAECRRIRPETPVVLITGYGDRELEKQAAKSGAYAFLHKPVAAESFCAVIDRAASHARSGGSHEPSHSAAHRWYIDVAEVIRRRSEAITAQLRRPLTVHDPDGNPRWAEDQAERIIEAFLDEKGSDDLLKIKDEIARALRRAYRIGTRRASIHGVAAKTDMSPDIRP